MSKFIIEIKTDNAAFEDDNWGYELSRILKEIAEKLEDGYLDFPSIMDSNGNRVGFAKAVD